jgi:hypothetical protein
LASGVTVLSGAEPALHDDLPTPEAALGNVLVRVRASSVNGSVRVPVQRAYPLADAPTAFAVFAAGTLGKLAISLV